MDLTTRYASGILDRHRAIELAEGFADLYEEPYIVMQYTDGFDVEPAKTDDTVGVTPFVIHRTGG